MESSENSEDANCNLDSDDNIEAIRSKITHDSLKPANNNEVNKF